MTPAPGKAPEPAMLKTIRQQVMLAVTELFHRATASVADDAISKATLRIEDDKLELDKQSSGSLMDCEFGMILLLVRDWFHEDQIEQEFLSNPKFERVILALVERVVDRVLGADPKNAPKNAGGEGKPKPDNSPLSFFTGEPYTAYQQSVRLRTYSANLDAAMITLAFLAPALKQYNKPLADRPYSLKGLPSWVVTLRDAALFVIGDGLRYALDCRIIVGKECQGFTCDPNTRDQNPLDGGFKGNAVNDRLFYTWTACETIRDMTGWRDGYLDSTQQPPLPPLIVAEIKPLIKQLDEALLQAAAWLKKSELFYANFKAFNIPDTIDLVESSVTAESLEQIDKMMRDVQHVYHLSQYAAIRSLVPEGVDLEEVRTIVSKLDELVRVSIMKSGLDASKNSELFLTLTREYRLGSSLPENIKYTDDAWYPLVVRSLSGLLSRSLRGFELRFLRSDVEVLTKTFEEKLVVHFENLLNRRPEGGESGPDGKLWSYTTGEPYVLYGTQRTIFALMTYADFLAEVARFREVVGVDLVELRKELSLQVANKFADELFGPAIDQILKRITPSGTAVGGLGAAATLPADPRAAEMISTWLAAITGDFQKIMKDLGQMADQLILGRDTVAKNRPKLEKSKSLQGCDGRLKEIYVLGSAGEKLSKLDNWEKSEVVQILFSYLFEQHAKLPDILDSGNKHMPPLYKLIWHLNQSLTMFNGQD